jgi:hypothetical protein
MFLKPKDSSPYSSPAPYVFLGLSLCSLDMDYDYLSGVCTLLCRTDKSKVFARDDQCPDDALHVRRQYYCACGTKRTGPCPELPDGCCPCIKTVRRDRSGIRQQLLYARGACGPAASNRVTCDSKGVFLARRACKKTSISRQAAKRRRSRASLSLLFVPAYVGRG